MTAQLTWEDAVQRLIDDPTQTEFVRDCYYDQPTEIAADRFWRSSEWSQVRALLGPARGAALDVGAGNGIVSLALARDGWSAYALEPDPSDLVGAGAIRRLGADANVPIEILAGYGESVPVEDRAFDVVVARQVLHHANDLDAFCVEMARILKPGGLFFSWRDHVITDDGQLEDFFDQHPLHRLYGGENAYTEARYQSAIEGTGLKVQKRWRQFEAAFNYAPKTSEDVAREALGRLVPGPLARLGAKVAGLDALYPLVGKALSSIDRRPGRTVAFLARKPSA